MTAGAIEIGMIFAVGFLAAILLALLALPLVAQRAIRLAQQRLERRLPLSMTEIAAERDGIRAAHAVEVRQLEQRIERASAGLAAAMAETGRQATRLVTADERHRVDAGAIGELEATLAGVRQRAIEAEATAGAQTIALSDVSHLAERRAELLATAMDRLAIAESHAAQLQEARDEVSARDPGLIDTAALEATPDPSAPRHDTMVSSAADSRVLALLRAEQAVLRNHHTTAIDERDKLRLRVDELLLQIEDLQEKVADAEDQASADRRRSSRQDRSIALLSERLSTRDAEIAEANRQAAALSGAEVTDATALRLAVTRLAADLVRFAGGDTPDGLPLADANP